MRLIQGIVRELGRLNVSHRLTPLMRRPRSYLLLHLSLNLHCYPSLHPQQEQNPPSSSLLWQFSPARAPQLTAVKSLT